MGDNSKIQWTNHTFNPWWGCTKVSPGCDHCYAETFDKRVHGVGKGHWGKDMPRRTFKDAHWNEPLKWNAAAQRAGVPALVFCASMADWCDVDAPPGAVERLHGLWRATPWLRWQMLTKRPARIAANLPVDWGAGYSNVWLGTTVEDQLRAESRVPALLSVPAVVRFLSIEPLLESVSLVLRDDEVGAKWNALSMGIHWVIVGGESGGGARPFDIAWARRIRDQCASAGVAFFMKQLGADPREAYGRIDASPMPLKDHKGGNWDEWPEDLRVREFPSCER